MAPIDEGERCRARLHLIAEGPFQTYECSLRAGHQSDHHIPHGGPAWRTTDDA